MIQAINNMQDVTTFIEDVAREISGYSPFVYFEDYVDAITNQPKYTPEQAAHRNRLLDGCFEICAQEDCDFIGLSLAVFEEAKEIIAYMQESIDNPQNSQP